MHAIAMGVAHRGVLPTRNMEFDCFIDRASCSRREKEKIAAKRGKKGLRDEFSRVCPIADFGCRGGVRL